MELASRAASAKPVALRLVARAYVEPLRRFRNIVPLVTVLLVGVISMTVFPEVLGALPFRPADQLSKGQKFSLFIVLLAVAGTALCFVFMRLGSALPRYQRAVTGHGMDRRIGNDDVASTMLYLWVWLFIWTLPEALLGFRAVERVSGNGLIARTAIDCLVLLIATAGFAYFTAAALLKVSSREISGTVAATASPVPAGFRTGIVLCLVPLVMAATVLARFGIDYRLLSIDPRFGRLLVERTGIALALVVFVTYLALVYRDSLPVAQEGTS